MSGQALTAKHTLVVFALGAVVDFAWGYMKWHAILAGVVSIVLGVPVTALVWFPLKGAFSKSKRPK